MLPPRPPRPLLAHLHARSQLAGLLLLELCGRDVLLARDLDLAVCAKHARTGQGGGLCQLSSPAPGTRHPATAPPPPPPLQQVRVVVAGHPRRAHLCRSDRRRAGRAARCGDWSR
eukprot:COSAG01_NODE_446_length_16939_cov_19.753518_2_plen_115_part_00